MTTPTAGWYADPQGVPGGSDLRYWDGTGWTASTQPGSGQQQPGQYPNQQWPAQQPGYPPMQNYPPAPSPANAAAGLWKLNRNTFITVIISVIYLVIASFAHLVFFGILPILYTVRSFQAKESLAWLAAVVTAVTIAFSIWRMAN